MPHDSISEKTSGLISNRRSCFCAFCKTPRKVYKSKNLSTLSIVSIVGLSFLITQVIWQSLDPRGLVILGLMLAGGEVFSQIRYRQAMICTNCGFDPILYLRDPEAAGLRIKDFIQYRSEKPEYLLRPPVKMPVRKVSKKGEKISLRG